MPIPKDYAQLVDDLTAATERGVLEWQLDKSVDSPYVKIGDLIVKVYAGEDEDDRSFCSMNLVEGDDESKLRRRPNIDHWFVDEGDPDYDRMFQLVRLASRKAKRIEDKIGAIRKLLAERMK